MEQLPNGYTLELAGGAFPLSTDSMVLSHFVRPGKNARVLDLGAGCGTLGLLLCAANSSCHVTGIEIDPIAHAAAEANILRNTLDGRMESICADLRQLPSFLKARSFDCCISNPPYFSGGPASKELGLARRDDCCSTDDLFRAAAWALKYGGDFYLVHRPEKLAELIACGSAVSLEAKQLCLVRHTQTSPVSLILMKLRKGAKPGLAWSELTLHHPDGTPTDAYRQIYHL